MNKIMEALKSLVPQDQLKDISSAVESMLQEAKESLEAEYNKNLEEAYQQLTSEIQSAEKTAYQGYQEAYGVITDLRNRLETQKVEFEKTLEEGYEEAYSMLLAERAKNEKLEVEIYEEYDGKLAEMKSYIVEKVDQFLQLKGAEIYEQAKTDVLTDPRFVEHKVVLDKIVDLASDYMGDSATVVTSTKLDESKKEAEDLRAQVRIMEARNIRLSTENTRLNEQVKKAAVVTESRNPSVQNRKARMISEQKERVETAQKVSGRGHIDTEAVKVIAESNNTTNDRVNELLVLSGVKK